MMVAGQGRGGRREGKKEGDGYVFGFFWMGAEGAVSLGAVSQDSGTITHEEEVDCVCKSQEIARGG
jgi:hypothetical protein